MMIIQSLSAVLIIAPAGALAIFAYRYIKRENRVEQLRLAYMAALKAGESGAALTAGRAFYTQLNKGHFGEEQERLLKEDIG